MNLIRYYNQNRKKIWGIIIIIASAILLLQMINYFYKIKNEEILEGTTNNAEIERNTSNTIITTNQSVVTGESVSTKQLQNATTVIDSFISYCNNKELEKAYNLLTDGCKEQMYSTLESFERTYYQDVFNGKSKNCTVENWVHNTYKVRITEDMLSTGKSNNGYSKQDYITVEKVDDEYKLNINNYLGYTQINKTTEHDNITMEVISKNTYMEYEEYTIKVTNQTENTILLDRRLQPKSLVLQDSKQVQYSSYSHELTEPMLTISSEQTKEITIKFYSSYVYSKNIKCIIFSDLWLYNSQGQIGNRIEFKANV